MVLKKLHDLLHRIEENNGWIVYERLNKLANFNDISTTSKAIYDVINVWSGFAINHNLKFNSIASEKLMNYI